MAFVMGISSAQASLLNVQECFNDSSGVYAIVDFTSFHIFGLSEKSEGGGRYNYRDELSVLIRHRVPEAIFFRGNLIMTTIMEMANRRG
jgi:hypothetical protein